jgi:hypothetical protein
LVLMKLYKKKECIEATCHSKISGWLFIVACVAFPTFKICLLYFPSYSWFHMTI